MDSKINVVFYSISLDGKEIAKVPIGNLEHFISCVLYSVSSVSISLVTDDDVSIDDSRIKVLKSSCNCP